MNDVKRKGRGKGLKPALLCTSIRLEQSTIDFFKGVNPINYQAVIREVLNNYINQEVNNATHKTI